VHNLFTISILSLQEQARTRQHNATHYNSIQYNATQDNTAQHYYTALHITHHFFNILSLHGSLSAFFVCSLFFCFHPSTHPSNHPSTNLPTNVVFLSKEMIFQARNRQSADKDGHPTFIKNFHLHDHISYRL
jgi:hypothetical protein